MKNEAVPNATLIPHTLSVSTVLPSSSKKPIERMRRPAGRQDRACCKGFHGAVSCSTLTHAFLALRGDEGHVDDGTSARRELLGFPGQLGSVRHGRNARAANRDVPATD